MMQTALKHLRRRPAASRSRRSTTPAPAALALRLAGHRLFRNADAAIIERCEGFFEAETLCRGTDLFAQDDHAEHVYVIVGGYARLSYLLSDGREMSVALVGPGEFIGEEALAGVERRPWLSAARLSAPAEKNSARSFGQMQRSR